jgi:diadenosine tetraphosphate (Ap4A) HIT family hydrolase
MTDFRLDPRLASDCIVLGETRLSLLLLMNNALVPWFILVPRRNETELFELPKEDQLTLLEEINLLCGFLKRSFKVEKLNVAAIGNIVRQLHIHVVGRNATDFRWPDVVWGAQEKTPYSVEEITSILGALQSRLPAGMFLWTWSA